MSAQHARPAVEPKRASILLPSLYPIHAGCSYAGSSRGQVPARYPSSTSRRAAHSSDIINDQRRRTIDNSDKPSPSSPTAHDARSKGSTARNRIPGASAAASNSNLQARPLPPPPPDHSSGGYTLVSCLADLELMLNQLAAAAGTRPLGVPTNAVVPGAARGGVEGANGSGGGSHGSSRSAVQARRAGLGPLAVDCEGVNLGRTGGRLCLLQLAARCGAGRGGRGVSIWLVDVEVLGEAAFRTRAPWDGVTSLRGLLEDTSVTKYLYDVRSDAAALASQFGVRLRGVVDLQLADVAVRQAEGGRRAGAWVQGLVAALSRALAPEGCSGAPGRLREDLAAAVATSKRYHEGNNTQVWAVRPLTPELCAYAATDVRYLHLLADALNPRLNRELAEKVALESHRRTVNMVSNSRDAKAAAPVMVVSRGAVGHLPAADTQTDAGLSAAAEAITDQMRTQPLGNRGWVAGEGRAAGRSAAGAEASRYLGLMEWLTAALLLLYDKEGPRQEATAHTQSDSAGREEDAAGDATAALIMPGPPTALASNVGHEPAESQEAEAGREVKARSSSAGAVSPEAERELLAPAAPDVNTTDRPAAEWAAPHVAAAVEAAPGRHEDEEVRLESPCISDSGGGLEETAGAGVDLTPAAVQSGLVDTPPCGLGLESDIATLNTADPVSTSVCSDPTVPSSSEMALPTSATSPALGDSRQDPVTEQPQPPSSPTPLLPRAAPPLFQPMPPALRTSDPIRPPSHSHPQLVRPPARPRGMQDSTAQAPAASTTATKMPVLESSASSCLPAAGAGATGAAGDDKVAISATSKTMGHAGGYAGGGRGDRVGVEGDAHSPVGSIASSPAPIAAPLLATAPLIQPHASLETAMRPPAVSQPTVVPAESLTLRERPRSLPPPALEVPSASCMTWAEQVLFNDDKVASLLATVAAVESIEEGETLERQLGHLAVRWLFLSRMALVGRATAPKLGVEIRGPRGLQPRDPGMRWLLVP